MADRHIFGMRSQHINYYKINFSKILKQNELIFWSCKYFLALADRTVFEMHSII
jgi:hypothetical protein